MLQRKIFLFNRFIQKEYPELCGFDLIRLRSSKAKVLLATNEEPLLQGLALGQEGDSLRLHVAEQAPGQGGGGEGVRRIQGR